MECIHKWRRLFWLQIKKAPEKGGAGEMWVSPASYEKKSFY